MYFLKKGFLFGWFFVLSFFSVAQTYVPISNTSEMKVPPVVEPDVYAFDFSQVVLKDSEFKQAMEASVNYLMKLDPDRLLSQFRSNAGLEPKAARYGGWESAGLAGHSLGHYLSGLSIYYSFSNDSTALKKINYVVEELSVCQRERGTGYVGAIPNEDDVFYRVALGEIQTGGFDLNGAWAPWYTIHKIMAGLLDAYIYTRNQKALEVNTGIADWADNLLRGLTMKEVQKMLKCEYGGMNETLANTYALTGDKKYLELSQRFEDTFVVDSLENRVNPFPGKHSNTNIPKAIAAMRQYELTGASEDKTAGLSAWNFIYQHHTYAPGGNGNYEYFGPEDSLSNTLTDNTMETCATYNMLKLSEHVFSAQPDAQVMDYYERALYNHILASQNRHTGMTTYFLPLRMGAKKSFSDPYNTFTCCVGSSMENHVRYGKSIYSEAADGSLYVNLFIPSELTWSKKKTTVHLTGNFPYEENFSIQIKSEEEKNYTINIRKPYWVKENYSISLNGEKIETTVNEKGYIEVTNTWKGGDELDIYFPMNIHQMALPDNESRVAFFYGPVLIAGDLGKKEPDPSHGTPVFVTKKEDPSEWIEKVNDSLQFKSVNTGKPGDVTFKPLYDFTDNYYNVYWDVFTPAEWKEQKQLYAEERERKQTLKKQTIDEFRIGEMQPERDHLFEGEHVRLGEDHTRKFRVADNGGSMQFQLLVDSVEQNELILTYWGMDNRGRHFSIAVDGVKIADVDLDEFKESRFYDIHYNIPKNLTKGKEAVTILLEAEERNQAGPVYGVRMIRQSE